ncbi:MAG: ferrochelatase [Acaryochloridaceae cyanobacterium RU_4_10]|nr:ferrochelatase [Acaryochloridaceae cyanobacterium RU_4_10]
MGYGEVERYEDFANYNEQALNLLTAKFAPVPTWIYPPLAKLLAVFDLHEWGHTHHNFVSPHNAIFEKQRAGIEAQLQERWGDRVQVFKAFNFCAPFLPSQVLAEIKAQGFSKLLIYPLLVVDSIFTSGIAVEQVNQGLEQLSVDSSDLWLKSLRYIPSFFDQPDYMQLLVDRIDATVHETLGNQYAPSQIGIVLMNHGCPHKAKGFVSGIDESQALYEKTRELLMYRYPLISVGWLNHDTPLIDWTQPAADKAARNLIELGAKAIVFAPIGFATENHETLLDVHHIIHGLEKKSPKVKFVQMDCVNDHPEFLAMAARWAVPQIEALLAEPVAAAHSHHAHHEHNGHVHTHNGHVHHH